MKFLKFKTLSKVFFSLLLIVVLGILGLTFLSALGIPENNKIYVVETPSMEPAIKTGSLIFVSPQERTEYKVGDVITFKSRLHKDDPKEYVITHRIAEVIVDNGDRYYRTKGDNNDDVDPILANGLNVIGKVNSTIPGVGYVIGFAKTPTGFLLLIVLPSIFIIILEILGLIKEVKRYIQRNYIPMPKLHTNM